ncbi:Biopolymer transport protein ExbB [Pseudobythopirellula maris]|uniref:Biopolymer transport protein ExbB n=1 Tax=Pseudobythopirellula maris TaxID=2527991 RepID=A0A5C5ZHI9_9BACT|nr:MotA/TolQ/ExbB proton channel family protein [Pseudobythopirellula maris]TWT86822.1 Biopolymer transport protein ExbB [Pseudobythopirellula maris]
MPLSRGPGAEAPSRSRPLLATPIALLAAAVVFAALLAAAPEALAQPGADAVAAEATAAATEPPRTSYLSWAFKSLGIGYSLVFLALSFTLVSLLVMNALKASRGNLAPPDLVEAFESHLDAKRYTEAYELANTDESFLGKVLAAGLGKLSGGGDYNQAIEAMQEVGEQENMRLEHRLGYMALIGSISPMIGLLGTVQGMIGSFNVIATSPTTPKPSALAEGISTALFTTLVGLAIAIPAIAIYNVLRNRIAQLVLEIGITSEGLMSRFQKVGK